MNILKSNEQRARVAIILVWIVLAIDLLSVPLNFWRYNFLDDDIPAYQINQAILSDSLYTIIILLYCAALVISAITFIQWFRRAYYNLHIKVKHLSYKEGWASGGWFIPIGNYFIPYQIMKELYIETDKLLSNTFEKYSSKKSFSFIGVWWILWILMNFLDQISFRLNDDSMEMLKLTTQIDIVSSLLDIPLTLLTVKIIKEYAKMESFLFLSNK